MDALKRNLFYIICGVVAVAGIVLSALGLRSMTKVGGRMSEAGNLLQRLNGAARTTVNRSAIRDAAERMDTIQANYQEVVDWAYQMDRRPPLVPGVFPDPRGLKKTEFRNAYLEELEHLLGMLKPGEPPSQREIGDMADKIKNEQPRREEPKPGTAKEEKKEGSRSELITDEEARTSKTARAALVKAQTIYCYANLDSLQVVSEMDKGGIELAPEVLWDAQRTLWVQQDVVEALARLNNSAASRLKEEGKSPWVGVLPVKDVVSIRVSGYVLKDSKGEAPARPGGPEPAKPPGTTAWSFTDCSGTELYDVLQFTVKLVVDARQIPLIIDEICKDRFYTPLRVSYLAQPPNLKMADKIYGEDPVVSLVVDFEAYYFEEIYRRLMPDAVLKEIGRERPKEKEEGKP